MEEPTDLLAAPKPLDPEQVKEKALALCGASDADVMLINGSCFNALEERALEILRDRRANESRPKKLIFVLATPGGSPDVAFRIGRAIQNTYDHSEALVAGWCKSAGTMLLITANTLVMGDEAELGPLDIQLAKRDEIDERDSGLVISEALDNLEHYAFRFFDSFMRQIKDHSQGLVTLKTASDIASSVAKGLFEPIYRQIDPQKIGEVARSMAVGRAYGQRLNVRPKNLAPRALENLLMGYPSHSFVIDRDEAQRLFKSVRQPSSAENELLIELGSLATTPCREPVVLLFEAKEESHEDKPEARAVPATGRQVRPAGRSRQKSR